MANYTPDAPLILGEEWVPIKFDPRTLSLTQEVGHSFFLDMTSTIVTGRTYVQNQPLDALGSTLPTLAPADSASTMMSVYPRGLEAATGPIKTVIVPCDGGAVFGDAALSGSSSVSEALARVGDNRKVIFQDGDEVATIGSGGVDMSFNFNDATELTGKRIVRVEWLYSLLNEFGVPYDFEQFTLSQDFVDLSATQNLLFKDQILANVGPNFTSIPGIDLPRFNSLWGTAAELTVGAPATVFPWTYDGLKKLDASAAVGPQVLSIFFLGKGNGSIINLEYSALRIYYCEEQRVAVGGYTRYQRPDANSIQLRSPATLAPGGVLMAAGNYTVTIDGSQPTTDVYALRELYPMPLQPGVVVNVSTTEGIAFTSQATDQLVQLSLHTASAAVTGVHGYGRQIQAPVWGASANPAQQEIVSLSGSSAANYPWARFYARRFGDTFSDLTLRHSGFTSIAASISVEEFDALEEIVDGWKEVTLRFDSPTPSFGNTGSIETYEWVSNEIAGNQWQVLGASAFVRNGALPLEQITGPHSLDATTYGGSAANLTWNGFSDTTSDGVLMFAQEMPAVSGLAIQTASLEVTGIGLDCGVPPECIPTGISYNSLTWTALSSSSVPASGFGYYELQRFDSVDADWSTILQATSPLVTGFSDYEARVGIESRYRIRFQHRLLFASPWSSEVANTLPAPGVVGTNAGTGVLIFTSNEVQDGSRSLAYAMQWTRDVSEEFSFLEAAQVQLQRMYGRDFQIAFRPTERGGERFQRLLLVQAAAVPTGLIRDGFTSLRDLAWDDISYVCVRDELGDRWLATVIVPDGRVQRQRRLYMANVDIIEVTDTPSIVAIPEDGSACTEEALWDDVPGWDYGCWAT